MINNTNFQQTVHNWSGLISGKVCYLPGLGPSYFADKSVDKVLYDILNNAASEDFLVYDKNKRWYDSKQEKIIVSEITYGDDWLCVPTFNSIGSQLKIYYFSNKALDIAMLSKIADSYEKYRQKKRASRCSVLSFIQPSVKAESRHYNIYLKIINEKDQLSAEPNEIFYYNELDEKTKATFALLGKESDMDGFSFLNEQLAQNGCLQSSIVCLVRDNVIIGAIGPLDVLNDGFDTPWLLPPYFGVKAKFRGKDCGERLWDETMNYAFVQGAKYTLVQNSPDSLAAQFYENQGLEKAGEVHVINLYCKKNDEDH